MNKGALGDEDLILIDHIVYITKFIGAIYEEINNKISRENHDIEIELELLKMVKKEEQETYDLLPHNKEKLDAYQNIIGLLNDSFDLSDEEQERIDFLFAKNIMNYTKRPDFNDIVSHYRGKASRKDIIKKIDRSIEALEKDVLFVFSLYYDECKNTCQSSSKNELINRQLNFSLSYPCYENILLQKYGEEKDKEEFYKMSELVSDLEGVSVGNHEEIKRNLLFNWALSNMKIISKVSDEEMFDEKMWANVVFSACLFRSIGEIIDDKGYSDLKKVYQSDSSYKDITNRKLADLTIKGAFECADREREKIKSIHLVKVKDKSDK